MTDLEKRLHAAIDGVDTEGIVALLAPLSEPERAALAPGVARRADELHRLNRQRIRELPPLPVEYRRDRERLTATYLAWLGTGDPDTLPPPVDIHTDSDAWYRRMDLQDACASRAGHQVLADRRPSWLPRLAGEYLDYGHWLWDWAWRLVVDGLIPRPDSVAYLSGLAAHAGKSGSEPLSEMVRRDPALLEVDLPALLTLPDGLSTLVRGDDRNVGRPPDLKRTRVWSPLLAATLPAGHPLRDRVLTGVLDVLGGDVGRDAAMYHQFLAALRPTVAELADRRQRLLRLAGHRVPSVVGVAVQALVKVDRAGSLDPADVVDRLGPAAGASSATTARAAVKLMVSALRRRPDLAAAAAGALAPALTHPRPDVQLDAVRALAPHAADPAVGAALTAAAPDLAPTVAAELGGRLPADPATEGPDFAALLAGAAVFETASSVKAATGLDVAVAAVRTGTEPPPVVVQPWRDARPTAGPVTPVDGLDDLIEALLRVVDGTVAQTSTMERALDGLAALGPHRPDDFGRRVGPLLARVNHIFTTYEPDWGDSIAGDFCYLVANWIEPDRVIAGEGPLATPRDWLVGRIREVALILQHGIPARLLALPTDEADWIDPVVLAERVLAAGDTALDRPLDTAIAVARLAPWRRSAARDRLAGVAGTLAAVIRAACGSSEDISAAPDPVRHAVAWQLGQPHAGPPYLFGEPAPAPPARVDRLDMAGLYAQANHTPMPDGSIFMDPSHLPDWQAWQRWQEHVRAARYATGWAASQWPGDIRWVWASDLHARRALRWLLDPDEPLPPEALAQVLRQVADDAAERRTLATDVLSQLITDGRLTSGQLGAALAIRPAPSDADPGADPWHGRTAGRVVDALTRTASVSPLHRVIVRRSLAASAAAWRDLPARPLCALLTLLDQLCTADGFGLADAGVRATLTPLAVGRSKTAGLARRVLGHPTGDGDWPAAAAAAALAARLERARRLDDAARASVK
jgi:Family of unknown function (DUF6493)